MSNYTPQVGDRVRRTHLDGTILEGVIAQVGTGWAESESGFTLYDNGFPEQTELLERPFKLNTEPGTVYGAPSSFTGRVVRVDGKWLGFTGDDSHWYEDAEILGYIADHGWVEYNLDGSRKND